MGKISQVAYWQTKTMCTGICFLQSYPGAEPQNQLSGRWGCVVNEGGFRWERAVPLLRTASGPQDPLPTPSSRVGGPGARRGERLAVARCAAPGRAAAPELLFAVSLTFHFWFSSLRAPGRGVLDKPCRLWALTSESILSQMGTIDWNEKLILNQ